MDFYEQNLIGRVCQKRKPKSPFPKEQFVNFFFVYFFKKIYSLDFSGCEQIFPKIQQSASPN